MSRRRNNIQTFNESDAAAHAPRHHRANRQLDQPDDVAILGLSEEHGLRFLKLAGIVPFDFGGVIFDRRLGPKARAQFGPHGVIVRRNGAHAVLFK